MVFFTGDQQKATQKMLAKLEPVYVVNKKNILWATFSLIFFHQKKLQNTNCKLIKDSNNTYMQKGC